MARRAKGVNVPSMSEVMGAIENAEQADLLGVPPTEGIGGQSGGASRRNLGSCDGLASRNIS